MNFDLDNLLLTFDSLEMGCFSCRPQTEITEDPSTILYADVGAAAVKAFIGHRVLSESCSGGILYVQNGQLCHEKKCGSSVYHNLWGHWWDLKDIKEIRVVNDESVWIFASGSTRIISLRPGLKITIEGSFAGTDTLVAEMPDAMYFAQRLRDLIGTVPLINQI
jgi:hypothetical protein